MSSASQYKKVLTLCFLVLTVISSAARALAEKQVPTNERGLNAESYESDTIDDINLFNGNLTLTIPIGKTYSAGGALNYSLNLYYNSNVWHFRSAEDPVLRTLVPQAVPDPRSNAGLGWRLSFGELYAPRTNDFNEDIYWLYVAPDGSEHRFYDELHPGSGFSSYLYTRDSTYLRLDPAARKIYFPNGQIHTFNAGTRGRLARIEDIWGNYLNVCMDNGNGICNAETLANATWTITDKFSGSAPNRTHTIKFNGNGQLEYINLAAAPGADGKARRAQYNFHYLDTTIERHNKNEYDWPSNQKLAAVSLLDQISLPDTGGTYAFTYYTSYGGDLNVTGRLPGAVETAILPTGGKYRWEYTNYYFQDAAPQAPPEIPGQFEWMVSNSDGVRKKEVYNMHSTTAGAFVRAGTYNYSQTLCRVVDENNHLTSAYTKTTVVTPESHKTVNFFNTTFFRWDHGLPYVLATDKNNINAQCKDDAQSPLGGLYLSQELYESTVTGYQKKRQVYVQYVSDQADGSGWNLSEGRDLNRRLKRQRTVYLDDGPTDGTNRYVETSYSNFDGLGHYRSVSVGGNFKRGDESARVTLTNYNPNNGKLDDFDPNSGTFSDTGTSASSSTFVLPSEPWFLESYNRTTVTEDNQTARRDYCFENGLLLGERILSRSSPTDNDVVVKYARDGSGLITQETYFGGDNGGATNAGANLCALTTTGNQYIISYGYDFGALNNKAYLNAAANNEFLVLTSKTIDPSTGLPTAEEDASGVSVAYSYDLLGRKIVNTPSEGNGGRTVYTYNSARVINTVPTSAFVRVDTFGTGTLSSNTVLSSRTIRLDSFGRVAREEEAVPTTAHSTETSVRDTTYNAMGWKTSVSERMVGTPTFFTQYKKFDPFGRPQTITPPDGDGHDILMAYGGDRTVTRSVKRQLQNQVSETRVARTEHKDLQGRTWKLVEYTDESTDPTLPAASARFNFANQPGSVTTASSTVNADFPPSNAIDGNVGNTGANRWNGWNDGSQGAYSTDWVVVNLGDTPTSINRIEVYTLSNNFRNRTTAPDTLEEFNTDPDSGLGITDFDVQYQSGQGWLTVPNGRIINNNKVHRSISFPAVTTTAVRIVVHDAAKWLKIANNYSRIVEVEAYNAANTNVALRRNVTASSCVNGLSPCSNNDDPRFPPSSVVDGEKLGTGWGDGGGWNDGTQGQYASDWLQVTFNGTKTLDSINVITLRDDFTKDAPLPRTTDQFSTAPNSGFGITYFEVQYLSGNRWVRAPGGLITNNSQVMRQLSFSSSITTNAIRVLVRDSVAWTTIPNNYSRIVELEAWGLDEVASLSGQDTSLSADAAAAGGSSGMLETTYNYDIGNRVSRVTRGAQTRSFNYDNRGFLKSETHPEYGTTTYDGYDAKGHVGSRYIGTATGPFAQTYLYDRAERMTSVKETELTGGVQRPLKEFQYGNGTTAANRSKGKLETAVRYNYFPELANPITVNETYTYGGVGGRTSQRMTNVNINGTINSFTQGFAYDDLGIVSKIVYPTCAKGSAAGLATCEGVSYPRNVVFTHVNGYPTTIGEDTGNDGVADSYFVDRFIYHPNGLLKRINFPISYSWNQDNDPSKMARPQRIYAQVGNITTGFDTGSYSYDGAGSIKGIDTDTYAYDGLGRIKSASLSSGATTQQYGYDDYGNVTSISTAGTVSSSYTIPIDQATNRMRILANEQFYQYDAAGNTTKNGNYYYEYDGFNMVRTFKEKTSPTATTTLQNWAYVYTVDDERIWAYNRQDPSHPTSLWSVRDLDGNLLREWSVDGSTWAWSKDYIHGGRNTYAAVTPSNTNYFFLDHLGTPRLIVNSQSSIVESHKYLPFGQEAAANPTGSEKVKFTGHERDSNGGGNADDLDYMHARYYSSRNARFMSVDPVLDDALSGTAGWSRYSYVRNNPINAFDPDGRSEASKSSFVQKLQAAWRSFVRWRWENAVQEIMDYNHCSHAEAEQILRSGDVSRIPVKEAGVPSIRYALARLAAKYGYLAEQVVKDGIERQGGEILGSQVRVMTSKGLRIIDYIIRTPSGEVVAIEVKFGQATRGGLQLLKDTLISSEGGTLIGRQVPKGFQLGEKVVVETREIVVDWLKLHW